jgi:hypothetical protein
MDRNTSKKDKPPAPMVKQNPKDQSAGDQLAGLIIKAGAQLRKHIKWSNNSYHMIYGANSGDPKGYYLYGVLNEVEKACFSMMLTADWIKESEASYNPEDFVEEEQRINDNLLQSKIDELSVWERKMTELMVALVGFRDVNSEDYYRHFLAVHELQHLGHSQNDLREYYGMTSGNYDYQQRELHDLVDGIAKNLDVSKTWYVQKGRDGALKRKLQSFNKRFEYAFEKMEEQLRATLRTQYLSFGSQSRHIHVGTVSDERNLELKDVSAHVGRIGMLTMHVVVLVKELVGANSDGGAIETCTRIINENNYPIDLHRRRTNPDVIVGDFVVAGGDLAQVVVVNTSQKYGFKSFRVHFLGGEPLPGLTEDEFVGEHIRRIFRGEDLIKQTVEMIKKLNPDADPSSEEINQSMRAGIVLEWNNGLKEYALNQPGGKEKLEAFRHGMNKQVAPIKELLEKNGTEDNQ